MSAENTLFRIVFLIMQMQNSLPYASHRTKDENQVRNRKQFALEIISGQLQRYNFLRSMYQIRIPAQALQRGLVFHQIIEVLEEIMNRKMVI